MTLVLLTMMVIPNIVEVTTHKLSRPKSFAVDAVAGSKLRLFNRINPILLLKSYSTLLRPLSLSQIEDIFETVKTNLNSTAGYQQPHTISMTRLTY